MSDDILPTETGRGQVGRSFAVWIAATALACASVSTEPVDGLNGNLTRKSSGGAGATQSGAGGTNGSGSSAGAAGVAEAAGAAGGSNAGSGGTAAGAGSGNAGAGTISANSAGSAGSAGSNGGSAGAADAGGLVASGENLIENPGFEKGLSPWSAAFGGTLSVTTEQAHGGLHSGKVSDRTYDYQGAHYDLTRLVSPGASYAVSAYGRVGNGSGATLKLTAQLTCSGEANPRYASVREVTDASDSAWSALSGTLAIPAASDCSLVQLLLYLEGPPAGYDLYVDDVSVTPL